jgi:mannose-6-phosphate isomerase-like protein (cupin superfamily)
MPVDLIQTFVHLAADGSAATVEPTQSLWRDGGVFDRLLGVVAFESPEDLHPDLQEMHPLADEVLFVVAGVIEVVLDEANEEAAVTLCAGQSMIVPRGVWHRLAVREPGRLLFINSRRGMRSRRWSSKGGIEHGS